ncbi:oligomeric golgi complex component, COG2-domain-containing protein [Cyathus striatus]|nr:oligomeric golgi complex component, COG2-domain-containing protein [Cyathus striatus]
MPLTALSPSSSPHDPYEIDRLAHDLAEREASSLTHTSVADADNDPDLPVYVPLSHDNKYLSADIFNVEEFLLSRVHTSLPDLRSELRNYHSSLKEELVQLINDDYQAFISLSTNLRDEGARLTRLKQPLQDLRQQVLESTNELSLLQDEIQCDLEKRATQREQEMRLHLQLKISESATRLESLLFIASPEEDESIALEKSKLISHLGSSNEFDDKFDIIYESVNPFSFTSRFQGNRVKHLHRVATEYTQLLYHVSKAQQENCVSVNEVQRRIDRIQSTLSSDLNRLLSETLTFFIEGKNKGIITDIEHSKRLADLTDCLRIYDLLGLWRDAEDILRKDIVRNFLRKTVYAGALDAAHSPIIPHTPFHQTIGSDHDTDHPRMPYTPFTAFVSKTAPQHLAVKSDTKIPQVHTLDDHDNQLASLYNQILRFVARDLYRIMSIAEMISTGISPASQSSFGTSLCAGGPLRPKEKRFQIMANVVWEEIGHAIMEEIGTVVFAAGRPDQFRKHYETTQAFLRSLESLAPSVEAVEEMRSHAVYTTFTQRWQLPVYFQLRWKEIISQLEERLQSTRIEPTFPEGTNSFATSQALAIWDALSTCWSADIYIPELTSRFWKLTLQARKCFLFLIPIISRYRTWLDVALPYTEINRSTTTQSNEKTSSATPVISRTATPVPSNEITPGENTGADDLSLKQYASVIVDISTFRKQVRTLWNQEISIVLPDTINHNSLIETEGALQKSLEKLTSLVLPLSNQIITVLTHRCCEGLLPVRSIPSQFRAMSNKKDPTEPSYFVSSVLRPLKLFFGIRTGGGPGVPLKEAYFDVYTTEVFNNVAQRYTNYLTTMRKTEESLKRLKKGKKTTFSLFSGNGSGRDDEGRDEERIRLQMILDVEAFGEDARSLGIKTDASEPYNALKVLVHATEGRNCLINH